MTPWDGSRRGAGGGPMEVVAMFWMVGMASLRPERKVISTSLRMIRQRSYGPDYVGLAMALTGYLILVFFVEPFHRLFYVNDPRIQFPHADVERVPVAWNFVYALFVPLFLLVMYNAITGASIHKHHMAYLGLFTSVILSSFLTDLVKNAVGRPRPDLISRCKPVAGTPHDVLVSVDVCTETSHHLLHDGWRSFPSGHSSFSFSGLGYLSMFLAGQLGIFRHRGGDLGRSLVCLAPLLGALMIAISRCEDYRHDVEDVCVGSVLGFFVALWSYHRFWPRLSSKDCSEPYPPLTGEESYDRILEEGRSNGLQ